MVNAGVEKGSVMGDENEALLTLQIVTDDLPRMLIQMIGRLIDQKEVVFLQKEGCQQDFGPLTA